MYISVGKEGVECQISRIAVVHAMSHDSQYTVSNIRKSVKRSLHLVHPTNCRRIVGDPALHSCVSDA